MEEFLLLAIWDVGPTIKNLHCILTSLFQKGNIGFNNKARGVIASE